MVLNKKVVYIIIVLLVVIGVVVFFVLNRNNANDQLSLKYKIGILNGYDFFGKTVDGFKAKMTELGYIEGKNIEYDVQVRSVDLEEYQSVLQKFVADKVDLILAFPTEASIEGKKVAETSGIPLVFANANVEDVDLINSIQEPGGNTTGVRYPGPDLALKRLEIMTEILPNAKRILVPYDKDYPNVPPQIKVLHSNTPAGITLIEVPVTSPAELQAYFDSLAPTDKKIDAILTLAEPVSADPLYVDVYGKFAQENGIPTGGAFLLKEDGYSYESLFGVSTNSFEVGRQAAILANKILRGIPAGTIPVVSAENFLEINYRAATEMGITLDEGLLSRADSIVR